MNTIFMNSGNSKTFSPHRFVLYLIDKISFILAYNKHVKPLKKSYKNNKIKISASEMNNEFELPDGS